MSEKRQARGRKITAATEAIAASIATVGNVGPAFGDVGATDNYGWMSDPALVVLSFFMLVGRLEIYTVLLLFHPEMWKARRSFH